MIRRRAVRALLLTPQGRILLMQAAEPQTGLRIWFAPGGGRGAGEDPTACLRREIQEETGVVLGDVGPFVWRRHHTFQWAGRWVHQDEEFYLVPTDEFVPDCRGNPSRFERSAFVRFAWWSPEQIRSSGERFAPRLLADHLAALLAEGVPDEPVDVGV